MYKDQKENLKDGECVVVMDFKENVQMGGSSLEIDRDFYGKQPASVFGLVMFFKKDGKVKKVHHDFVSDVLNHDSKFVNECMSKFVNSSDFVNNKFQRLMFWMDNGPAHFRTYEMVATFVSLERSLRNVKVEFNFFCEYHGKNECDSHFSSLTGYLKRHETCHEERVSSVDDLIKVYEDQNRRANDNKHERNRKRKAGTELEEICEARFHKHSRVGQHQEKLQVPLPSFTDYHHFTIEKDQIIARPLTGHEKSRKYKIQFKTVEVGTELRKSYTKRKANTFDKHCETLMKKARVDDPQNVSFRKPAEKDPVDELISGLILF